MNYEFVGIQEQGVVQGLCQIKPLICVYSPVLFWSPPQKKSIVAIEEAELIHNTGSISLGLRDGTDFMSEKITLSWGKSANANTGFHDTLS